MKGKKEKSLNTGDVRKEEGNKKLTGEVGEKASVSEYGKPTDRANKKEGSFCQLKKGRPKDRLAEGCRDRRGCFQQNLTDIFLDDQVGRQK